MRERIGGQLGRLHAASIQGDRKPPAPHGFPDRDIERLDPPGHRVEHPQARAHGGARHAFGPQKGRIRPCGGRGILPLGRRRRDTEQAAHLTIGRTLGGKSRVLRRLSGDRIARSVQLRQRVLRARVDGQRKRERQRRPRTGDHARTALKRRRM